MTNIMVFDLIINKGEMKNNMKHGKGVYKFANGNRYEGEW